MVRRTILVAFVSVFALGVVALAADAAGTSSAMPAGEMVMEMHPSSLTWAPLDLPGFVPGMQVAVLSGDPFKEGPYTIRLMFPKGYMFPAHWHPNVENLTVISGSLMLGQGDKTDSAKLMKYSPGDYIYIPPQHPHFGGAPDGETVIQLHGPGPFGVTVLEAMEGATPMPAAAPKP
jgi:quercetin dioxygenase-like cupin family protein